MKYVYIDIIKSLTPLDAKILRYINSSINNEVSGKVGVINMRDIQVGYYEICKEFPNVGWYINSSIRNLMRVHCIDDMTLSEAIKDIRRTGKDITVSRINTQTFTLTTLGIDFISSCMKD